MIEYVIIGALLGWFGHAQFTSLEPSPLAVSQCVEIQPPVDNTFGSTTSALLECVGTYRRCQTACLHR